MTEKQKRTRTRLPNVRKQLNRKPKPEEPKIEFISSGCWVLNLALTGDVNKGFPLGKFVNIVGDRSSGKSLLCLKTQSAAYHSKDNYMLEYDDAESGLTFDIEELFGFSPNISFSDTFEDFSKNFDNQISKSDKKNRLIYVLDSFDGFNDENDNEFHLKIIREFNQFFKKFKKTIKEKQTLLIIVSQVREIINPTFFGKKLKRNGGKALGHWNAQEIWLAEAKKIKKKVDKEDDVIGVTIKAKVEKNKLGMAYKECFFDAFFDFGIDNVGSGIDYLYELKTKTGETRQTGDITFDGKEFKNRTSIIEYIEENNMEEELKRLMQQKWDDRKEKLKTNRKREF